MAPKRLQPWSKAAWELARRQHGVVARSQLLALGMSADAIQHRIENLRFAESQIRFEPAQVGATLAKVANRLDAGRG